MRAYWWVVLLAAGGLLWGGGEELLGNEGRSIDGTTAATSRLNSAQMLEAQLGAAPGSASPSAPTSPSRRAQAKAAAPNASASPHRVVTTAYDSWVVTCQENAAKNTCLASLRVVSQNRVLLDWQIGFNQAGHLITAVHIPSGLVVKQGNKDVGGAILLGNGLELKFDNGTVRRLNFVSCGPRQCVAEAPFDESFAKEAMASTKATITVSTSGGAIPFEFSIKGIDNAILATRR